MVWHVDSYMNQAAAHLSHRLAPLVGGLVGPVLQAGEWQPETAHA